MKEIKINEDTRIAIEEGMEVTVTDNSVVFEKKIEFKNGDIYTDGQYIILCESFRDGNIMAHFTCEYTNRGAKYIDASKSMLRYATEEEKQTLFNEMAKHSMMWDWQQKKIVRWRADECEIYCHIGTNAEISSDIEGFSTEADSCYESGNYFHPDDVQRKESAALAIKKALDSVWEDLPKCEDS